MSSVSVSIEFLLLAVTSILAIMNPVSTSAVYFVLTEDATPEDRKQVIVTAMKISLFVLIFFALTGQIIFSILGLTIPAFKIAGGILLIFVAFGMLYPRNVEYAPDALENIAIVPLAFPLTCGAGTITTVILLISESKTLLETVWVYAAIIVAIFTSYIAMTYASYIFRFIGEQEIKVIPKLMAVFVLAIAIQFIINGVAEALPQILSQI
ncbi:MAG TPA: MarC family protein [Methanoregulaceae archaeon]|nr:MarC family protein [Methanoregulaceae archaeon]